MTDSSNPVDVDRSAAKLIEPGEPVTTPALSQLGATFAERAAARKVQAARLSKRAVDGDGAENKALDNDQRSTKSRLTRRKA